MQIPVGIATGLNSGAFAGIAALGSIISYATYIATNNITNSDYSNKLLNVFPEAKSHANEVKDLAIELIKNAYKSTIPQDINKPQILSTPDQSTEIALLTKLSGFTVYKTNIQDLILVLSSNIEILDKLGLTKGLLPGFDINATISKPLIESFPVLSTRFAGFGFL